MKRGVCHVGVSRDALQCVEVCCVVLRCVVAWRVVPCHVVMCCDGLYGVVLWSGVCCVL